MSDNKNQLKMAAENFANEVVNSLLKPTSQKNRSEQVPSAASTTEENYEHTRRYSFDDNGGGYLGL
jgi:hypothetical protein